MEPTVSPGVSLGGAVPRRRVEADSKVPCRVPG